MLCWESGLSPAVSSARQSPLQILPLVALPPLRRAELCPGWGLNIPSSAEAAVPHVQCWMAHVLVDEPALSSGESIALSVAGRVLL